MPVKMTDDQRRAFLAAGARTATLATIRQDGRPHAVPVWFVLDGDDIVISTGEATVKARNIERDPRVSVVVDDDVPPYAFVSTEGIAEITRDRDEMRRVGGLLGERYGAQGFEEYASGPDRILIRVRPNRVVAQDKLAG